jgi:predicted N-formylglutamate amidohydrolase
VFHPFELIIGAERRAFLFCDHASNAVPDWVELGVSDADMQRHIAWDIGTDGLGRKLSWALDCSALICGFSRLVVDANRDPESSGLIPECSDRTDIPGNHGLSHEERQARIERLYQPYHHMLGGALDSHPKCLAVSVHSFTPQLRGQPKRTTDIGLLVKDDPDTANAFAAQVTQIAPDLLVDINQPYSAYDLNWTVDHNVVPRGLRHLAIEVRQDHIATDQGQAAIADRLAAAIRPLL